MTDFKKKWFDRICLTVFLILLFQSAVFAEIVNLPLTIDYPLLTSLVVNAAFTGPNKSAVVLDEEDGCRKIVISNPSLTEQENRIRFESSISLHLGATLLSGCYLPVDWEGTLVVFQEPVVNSKTWRLTFETKESMLLNKGQKPPPIVGYVWKKAEPRILDYMQGISINLLPPVRDLKSFLLPLFPVESLAGTEKMLNSLTSGKITAGKTALQITLLADVEGIYHREEIPKPEVLTGEELDKLADTWQAWDSFLVDLFEILSKEPLKEDDRGILLDTLLEIRYSFVAGLTDGITKKDFVREQFISAWKQLSPVFRSHLGDDPSKDLLGFTSFFTAADALISLDRLSPVLGIDISRNGLITLGQMINKGESPSLAYSMEVDPTLRGILDLGPPPELLGPAFDVEEMEIGPDVKKIIPSAQEKINFYERIRSFFCPPVFATEAEVGPEKEKIKQWIFSEEKLDTYMDQVKSMLEKTSEEHLSKSAVDKKYHPLYRNIILSTAWQESCFRQFELNKRKVVYIRSYNGTSVGLMQVNERVWRGMFDSKHLRWDIEYNTKAGCEIIDTYFTKYALKKMEKLSPSNIPDNDALAGSIYAMYNGGPGQFEKFLERHRKGNYFLSDKLYIEKYFWLKKGEWDKISKCLIGG